MKVFKSLCLYTKGKWEVKKAKCYVYVVVECPLGLVRLPTMKIERNA